jgi:hypothetical protein
MKNLETGLSPVATVSDGVPFSSWVAMLLCYYKINGLIWQL